MVVDEVAIDHIGELSFQAALRFFGRLELSDLAVIVPAPGATISGLDDGGGMKSRVELTIAGTVEPVTTDIAARCFDGRSAGVAGEMALGLEAGDVAGVTDDLGGENRTDALDLRQGAATCDDVSDDRLFQSFELPIGTADVLEEVPSDLFALLIDGRRRTDAGKEVGRRYRRQSSRSTTRHEISQEDLETVHRATSVTDYVVPPIRQEAQHHGVILCGDHRQFRIVDGHRCHRHSVGGVVVEAELVATFFGNCRQARRRIVRDAHAEVVRPAVAERTGRTRGGLRLCHFRVVGAGEFERYSRPRFCQIGGRLVEVSVSWVDRVGQRRTTAPTDWICLSWRSAASALSHRRTAGAVAVRSDWCALHLGEPTVSCHCKPVVKAVNCRSEDVAVIRVRTGHRIRETRGSTGSDVSLIITGALLVDMSGIPADNASVCRWARHARK
jgi:hypothetical protein